MPPQGQFHQVDSNLLKRENERFQGSGDAGAFGDLPMLYLQSGTTQIRVLPPYSERGSWFKELKQHPLKVAGRFTSVVCPRQFESPCPLCEESQRLHGLGGEANVDESKKYRPKSTYFLNVLVHSAPDRELDLKKGVKILKCGVTVLKGLLTIENDNVSGYGDITNLEAGFDVRITKRGKDLGTTYEVMPMRERTSINDALKIANIDPSTIAPHNLDMLFNAKSYEDLKGVLADSKTAPGLQAPEPQRVVQSGPIPDAPVESTEGQDFDIPSPPQKVPF